MVEMAHNPKPDLSWSLLTTPPFPSPKGGRVVSGVEELPFVPQAVIKAIYSWTDEMTTATPPWPDMTHSNSLLPCKAAMAMTLDWRKDVAAEKNRVSVIRRMRKGIGDRIGKMREMRGKVVRIVRRRRE
jgi:hypothetical protein